MLCDPTVIPLTIVLLILGTIAVIQNLYKIAGFLVFTYFLYIFILWIRIEPVEEKLSTNSNVLELFQVNKSKMDSSSFLDNKAIEDSIEQISENYSQTNTVYRQPLVNEIYMSESINNRTPIKTNTEFPDSLESIYCFTTIENLNDFPLVITHQWMYENQYFSEVDIEIGRSYNWRCWSRISNITDWRGSWKVLVTDTTGFHMDSIRFVVKKIDSGGLRRVQ